jgi:integrase/recombinase XerD
LQARPQRPCAGLDGENGVIRSKSAGRRDLKKMKFENPIAPDLKCVERDRRRLPTRDRVPRKMESTPFALGRRDYALFALMFNTGARVQEVLNLRRRDARLDAPCQVRLTGKGSKVRLCPLWPATARLLRELIAETTRCEPEPANTLIFANARGSALTRYGVRYLLRRYVSKGARLAPTLKDKSLHPHSIRHSTAIALLKGGVDFATISQWLGHAGLNTTMRYARADLDLKRQAISQVFPDALAPPRGGRLLLDGSDMVGWLRRM